MKKILFICLTTAILASCGKEITYSSDYSSAAFINASTSVTGVAPRPGVIVYIDTLAKTSSFVAYRGTSGYLGITPGARKIELRPNNNLFSNLFVDAAAGFETNKASTYVIYDTLSATNTALKTIRLTDDLSLPSDGTIKVRFLHLANNAPAVDVTLVRTSATPLDSVTLTNQSYVGPNGAAAASTLSTFTAIPRGTYSVRVKLAGTQTIALTPVTLTTLSTINGIFTLYAAGTTGGQPLTANVFRHYP
jgi:hypothetical protein